MEATPLPIPGTEGWSEQFAAVVAEKREHAREYLTAQQQRLQRAEAELTVQLQIIADQVASEKSDTKRARSDIETKAADLAAQAAHLESLKTEFSAQQAEWHNLHKRFIDEQRELSQEMDRREADIARRHAELLRQQTDSEEGLARLSREKQSLEAAETDLQGRHRDSLALSDQLNSLKEELDRRRGDLDARAAETETSRRRIAREFKTQHAAHLKEYERLRSELATLGSADQTVLQQQLEKLHQRDVEREVESNALRKRSSELNAELKSSIEREADLSAEIQRLRQRETEFADETKGMRQRETDLAAEIKAMRQREAEFADETKGMRQRETELAAEIKAMRQRETEFATETKGMRQRETELAAEINGMRQRETDFASEINGMRQREMKLTAEINNMRQRDTDLDNEIKVMRQRETEFATETKVMRQRETEFATETKAMRQREAELAAELETARGSEANGLRKIEAEKKLREETAAELQLLREHCRGLEGQLAQVSTEGVVASEEHESILAERESLQTRVAELEAQLAAAQKQFDLVENQAETTSTGEREDSGRRYEMAMDDLRELKARNAELQQQLAKAQSAGGASSSNTRGGVLNWEAEKKRILAELESDFGDELSQSERLQIEDLVRKTDGLAAEKDREIEELKMLLDNQSNSLGNVAVGAAALGQLFDQDAIIQEERENLKRIQDEWREKFRLSEINISIERAKLARERSQLDERIRQLEEGGMSPFTPLQESKPKTNPSRGRWLEKLGLKDSGGEKKE